MTLSGPAAAKTTPMRETRFIVRRLQRVELPVEPGDHDFRVRYHGQKTFFRATRQQVEQVVALHLGDVQVDVVEGKATVNG